MKRIVIFADGTWNSPEKNRPSNVLQMARGICPVADDTEQIVFYDWGVGTDRKKVMGGLSGAGIDKNIMDCYRFIVHNYEPGDQLYFFGFSRGAYTVRSLGGFVRNCGVIRREHADQIPKAFKLYRKRSRRTGPNAPQGVKFRDKYSWADITEIEFVGVWDTVGSLGIPVPFWGTLNEEEFLFHDTEPSKIIRHARHALSIDEMRKDFEPTLWKKKDGLDLIQVWFPGVHSDVGGGYPERGLGDCAMRWMMDEAEKFGLRFEDHLADGIVPDPLDKHHNERKGIFKLRGKNVRKVSGTVHSSVKTRWDANAHDWRKKSDAMKDLMKRIDGDWSRVKIID